MQIESEKRLIDANLNRLREGIRVLEDIARYILNDLPLASRLKTLRHKARISDLNFTKSLLQHRDIKNDILKKSTISEMKRENIYDIAVANFKRSEESARVLEEAFKLESIKKLLCDNLDGNFSNDSMCEIFKAIRYELYDIEIAYFESVDTLGVME